MRIMYLCVTAEMGGAERSLFDVMASIRRAQPSWALALVTGAHGPLVDLASELGVATKVLPLPRSLARFGETGAAPRRAGTLRLGLRLAATAVPGSAYVTRVRREIARFKPDVLHTNSLKMHVIGTWAASASIDGRGHSAPVVWHMHDYVGTRPMTARLLRRTAARCAGAIANSASVADDVRRACGGGFPIATVLNAVDLDRFSNKGPRADLDQLAGLPAAGPGTVRVGLLATFGRWKGHTTFLDAIARLPRDLPFRAYVVGGALYRTDHSQHALDELRRYAARIGVADRVGFTGFVARPEDAMRALDIVVHASTSPEPFGLVIVEAMACGRAVVASAAGGATEIFTPGVDALSHAPGHADELAMRIEELMRDGGRRQQLGREGRRTAERRFDRARLAAELVPVYQQAIAGS